MDNINETKSPKELDKLFIDKITKLYGDVDMENDFFSDDLSTYYKTKDIDDEGDINHEVISLASFKVSFENLSKALNSLKNLASTEGKLDPNLSQIFQQLKVVFNKYRKHLRDNYPEEYSNIRTLIDEISVTGGGVTGATFTPGVGAQYATPFAFNKNKKAKGSAAKYYYKSGYKEVKEGIGANLGPGPKASEDGVKDNAYVKQFKYKLVPKDKNGNHVQKGSGLEVKQLFQEEDTVKEEPKMDNKSKFQKERIDAFSSIKNELDNIYNIANKAQEKTKKYYKANPDSYSIAFPTDLVLDYLKDIKKLLTKNEN